mgnify:FL=1
MVQFHTYILESVDTGKLYIGQTSDLGKRVQRHNSGGSRYTKGKGPWKLLFSVSCKTRSEAILLEKRLKGFKNQTKIKEWISRQESTI